MTKILTVTCTVLLSVVITVCEQPDKVQSDAILKELHRAYIGKIVFTAKSIPVESLKEADFLKAFELNDTADLAIKAFMGNPLTNYLQRLAPELPVDELIRKGNHQFSFYVDGVLVHKENLPAAWGRRDNKNTQTIYSASFLDSADSAARWGPIWHIFMLYGGHDALTAGKHSLRVEMRPYLQLGELRVGELIAAGELPMTVTKPIVDEKSTAIQPIQADSGWEVSDDPYDKQKIREMNRKIAQKTFKDIKSIVVIKDNKLLIEEYFDGVDRTTLQNTRSVGKSFASTMMGIAISEGHIKGENQPLQDFYDLKNFASYSPKKETVTIKSLLTMSSGFDATDDDPNSAGNEEKMYPTDNWVKFALDLPMDQRTGVGEKWRYFTAGTILLGDIINKSVPGGLEKYAEEKLFRPLGIDRYKWQYTPQKVGNTAGGLQMSALDFAKYGQLYKNGGRWKGKQVLPHDWITKTFTRHIDVPYGPNLYYGYLFWNFTYKKGDKSYEVFFATGNGGNKIFIFKDQPLVVVITATAFGKWYQHRQADRMIEKYILPALFN